MRVYLEEDEEALKARRLLKEFAAEGFIAAEQRGRLENETASPLRTTNVFLRVVLFVFTVLLVLAAAGLFLEVLLGRPSEGVVGAFCLVFAVSCYGGAEMAASQARLYRHGVEEALAACAVGFLGVGLEVTMSGPGRSHAPSALVFGACVLAALWIRHRFGLWYMFLAAMVLAVFVPGDWTLPGWARHVVVAAIYGLGLVAVGGSRDRERRDFAEHDRSVAEALLWLGLYAALNLKLSSWSSMQIWGGPDLARGQAFPPAFYWTTWLLTWCLPPLVLARGVRLRDRHILWAGGATALATFVTNKPYLGWARHTWDPILLGILLVAVALWLRRWLAAGEGGARAGFTAARLSAKDDRWTHAGALAGLAMPQPGIAGVASRREGLSHGGASGGAGASRDF